MRLAAGGGFGASGIGGSNSGQHLTLRPIRLESQTRPLSRRIARPHIGFLISYGTDGRPNGRNGDLNKRRRTNGLKMPSIAYLPVLVATDGPQKSART